VKSDWLSQTLTLACQSWFQNVPLQLQRAPLQHGSLAARDSRSRAAITAAAAAASKRVFDINLRKPFIDPELCVEHAKGCWLLKLNDEAERYTFNPADPTHHLRLHEVNVVLHVVHSLDAPGFNP
jgi:sugar/nucleoside kinase (ribokinase family)